MLVWRRFQFFDKELVKDEAQPGQPHQELSKIAATCCASGRGLLILGDGTGAVNVVERDFSVGGFQAYNYRVSHMQLVRERNLLATVGVDDDDACSTLKLWAMDRMDPATRVPPLLLALRMEWRGLPVSMTATCLAAAPDAAHAAVGFANGAVLGVALDAALRHPVLRLVCSHPGEHVTGLGFDADAGLYVVTVSGVYLHGAEGGETVLDNMGAELGCVATTEEGELVVGTRQAIYFWKGEDKAQCLAFEGDKRLLYWYRGNLVVVGQVPTPQRQLAEAAARGGVAGTVLELTVYDTRNKLIAFQDTGGLGLVAQVASEWGALFVLATDGRVFELSEKDTQSKLESLFRKNLYTVAVTLAANQGYDKDAIAEILKRYAEHLYSKGDFDGSIAQFIKTIGHIEPSFVIRKFLDAQRIFNLTSYLQALHEKGRATTDHTTLLLSCYTKLKDVNKLEQFLSTADAGTASFDVETAIKVCRQSGYSNHALKLSHKFHQHDWYLKIQIEDFGEHFTALAYIAKLPHKEAEFYLKKYGKLLVSVIPEETTQQLLRMCSGDKQSQQPLSQAAEFHELAASSGSAPVLSLSPIPDASAPAPAPAAAPAVTQPAQAAAIPPATSPVPTAASMPLAASLLSTVVATAKSILPEKLAAELREKEHEREVAAAAAAAAAAPSPSAETSVVPAERKVAAPRQQQPAVVERSKPEDFIHIFVGLPHWLMVFLETVIARDERVAPINYDTLLELYLRPAEDHSETPAERDERLEKALQLISSPDARYDPHHALVLAQRYDFSAGVMKLLEQLGMYNEIIQYHMERKEFREIITSCTKFGSRDPNLWVQVLSYFASIPDECSAEISEVLDNIDKAHLMPPLLVLQILARKPAMPLSAVKDYISSCLQAEKKMVDDNQREIAACREETEKMRAEIRDLQTNPRVFQVNKCTYCSQPLAPPTIHFLCMHSFHLHCLAEGEHECPLCGPANRQTLSIKRSMEQQASAHEDFVKQLEGAADGFTTIAEYAGRSIFGCLNEDGPTPC